MTTQFDPIRNADTLASQFTFGVEIEMGMPRSFWRDHGLTLNGYHSGDGETARRYSTSTALPSTLRPVRDGLNDSHVIRGEWQIQRDGSVHSFASGIKGCELISPVLKGTAGLREVYNVMTTMSDNGCTSNRTCGIHVHIGFGDVFAGRLYDDVYNIVRRLVNLFSEHEHAMVAIGGNPDRINALSDGHATSIKHNMRLVSSGKNQMERIGRGIRKSNATWNGTDGLPEQFTAPDSIKKLGLHAPRGHWVALNLGNLFGAKKTVEFRIFRGSTHPIKVIGMIMVALGLCSRAAQTTICRKFNSNTELPDGKTWTDAVDSLHSVLNWAYIKDSWAKGAVRYGDATGTEFWNDFGKRILKNQRWNAKRFVQLANRGRSPHHSAARANRLSI